MNEDGKQLVGRLVAVHRDVKLKLNQRKNMYAVVVVVTKDVIPIRMMMATTAIRRKTIQRLN